MKNKITAFTIILFIIAGFVGCKNSDSNHLITVDVTKSYPEKELILQDLMHELIKHGKAIYAKKISK